MKNLLKFVGRAFGKTLTQRWGSKPTNAETATTGGILIIAGCAGFWFTPNLNEIGGAISFLPIFTGGVLLMIVIWDWLS